MFSLENLRAEMSWNKEAAMETVTESRVISMRVYFLLLDSRGDLSYDAGWRDNVFRLAKD